MFSPYDFFLKIISKFMATDSHPIPLRPKWFILKKQKPKLCFFKHGKLSLIKIMSSIFTNSKKY